MSREDDYERESAWLNHLVGLWRLRQNLRAVGEMCHPTSAGQPFNEVASALENLEDDMKESILDKEAFEWQRFKDEDPRAKGQRMMLQRRLLNEAVAEDIELMVQERKHRALYGADTIVTALQLGKDIGAKCCICGRVVPRSDLRLLCACAKVNVHKSCLAERLRFRCATTCELCGREYDVERRPYFTTLQGLWTWLFTSASRIEMLLLTFLLSLVVTTANLLREYRVFSTRSLKVSLVNNNCQVKVGDRWRIAEERWHHVIVLNKLPEWFLPLVVFVFLLNVALSVALSVRNVKSFRSWHCKAVKLVLRQDTELEADAIYS